jgi:hypothetical protein
VKKKTRAEALFPPSLKPRPEFFRLGTLAKAPSNLNPYCGCSVGTCSIGAQLCGTSESSVKAKFAQFPFHAVSILENGCGRRLGAA